MLNVHAGVFISTHAITNEQLVFLYQKPASKKKEGNMNIMFSSKTFEMTEKLKQFLMEKLGRLSKYPSLGIQQLQVIIDRVKRNGRTTSSAQVEVIAEVKGRRYAFREIGDNIYQAFYRVYEKIEKTFRREAQERKHR